MKCCISSRCSNGAGSNDTLAVLTMHSVMPHWVTLQGIADVQRESDQQRE